MNITNDHNLPSFVVDALTTDTYSKGKSNRSVTQLIDAPRIGVLFSEHEDSIDKDAVEFLWTRFGTSVHNMFEDAVESKENLITASSLTTKSLLFGLSSMTKKNGIINLMLTLGS
jgi:hypothetical protein